MFVLYTERIIHFLCIQTYNMYVLAHYIIHTGVYVCMSVILVLRDSSDKRTVSLLNCAILRTVCQLVLLLFFYVLSIICISVLWTLHGISVLYVHRCSGSHTCFVASCKPPHVWCALYVFSMFVCMFSYPLAVCLRWGISSGLRNPPFKYKATINLSKILQCCTRG